MIAVRKLTLQQGMFALENVELTIPTGKYGVLMGKTGCGKTSLLEAIAGLRSISMGAIMLTERDVSSLPPGAREIGYVPQDAALFPTMTVRDHLSFALSIRRLPLTQINERVQELADWLEISHLLNRRPFGLSGGEAQRVALGRALSFRPRYLLMDEPLSSLDETTHDQMLKLLQDIRTRSEATVLHVTHSRREAEQLADVRFVLDEGVIRLSEPET